MVSSCLQSSTGLVRHSYNATGNAAETQGTNAGLSGSDIVTDTTSTFDPLGRQLTKTVDDDTGSPKTTSYVYDAVGRPTSLTDESNHTTSSSYDALGRVTTVTHPDSSVDTTTYDAAGEQLTRRVPHSLLLELFTDAGIGTMVVP